ncbi:MAG TPA: hypothetical protein VE617_11620 [Propionibacteriaceae bacterium]|nr:hypothetical protein [Propionibacteriaceae bacterium]
MGTTGLIFAAIAIAWLAYLVPHFVRRREDESVPDVDPADRFADSMRIVRNGTAPLLDQDLERIPRYEVSTPHTRQAAIRDLHRQARVAAARRRRVLLVLLAALSLLVGLSATGIVAWWTLAVPGLLLVAFVVGARLSVGAIRRSLDERYEQIRTGSNESTIFLSREDLAAAVNAKAGSAAAGGSAARTDLPTATGALWDPVPITVPTYVSKPLAPRTVRTIDLSGPTVAATTARPPVPVTADPPDAATDGADGDDQQREAATA